MPYGIPAAGFLRASSTFTLGSHPLLLRGRRLPPRERKLPLHRRSSLLPLRLRLGILPFRYPSQARLPVRRCSSLFPVRRFPPVVGVMGCATHREVVGRR
jgi:hypothetical protein